MLMITHKDEEVCMSLKTMLKVVQLLQELKLVVFICRFLRYVSQHLKFK